MLTFSSKSATCVSFSVEGSQILFVSMLVCVFPPPALYFAYYFNVKASFILVDTLEYRTVSIGVMFVNAMFDYMHLYVCLYVCVCTYVSMNVFMDVLSSSC